MSDNYYYDDEYYDDERPTRRSRSRGNYDYDRGNNRDRGISDNTSNSPNDALTRSQVAGELRELMGQSILVTLSPNQLNILNQVFRPIMCGRLVEVSDQYIELEQVNIKMSNAPEFIFPTPLIIPLVQLNWYMPFDCNIRFPLY